MTWTSHARLPPTPCKKRVRVWWTSGSALESLAWQTSNRTWTLLTSRCRSQPRTNPIIIASCRSASGGWRIISLLKMCTGPSALRKSRTRAPRRLCSALPAIHRNNSYQIQIPITTCNSHSQATVLKDAGRGWSHPKSSPSMRKAWL